MYNINEKHTLYAIKAIMNKDRNEITIGKLGTFSFRKGMYVYVGSAKRNIEARINRHLKKEKKYHWHFDYLRPFVHIVDVTTFSGEEGECALFQRLMTEHGGEVVVKKFGSSDCDCTAHLFYVKPS